MTFQSTLISCNLCILNSAIFLTLENIRKDDQEWNGESRDTDNCRHKNTGRRKTKQKTQHRKLKRWATRTRPKSGEDPMCSWIVSCLSYTRGEPKCSRLTFYFSHNVNEYRLNETVHTQLYISKYFKLSIDVNFEIFTIISAKFEFLLFIESNSGCL